MFDVFEADQEGGNIEGTFDGWRCTLETMGEAGAPVKDVIIWLNEQSKILESSRKFQTSLIDFAGDNGFIVGDLEIKCRYGSLFVDELWDEGLGLWSGETNGKGFHFSVADIKSIEYNDEGNIEKVVLK